MYVRYKKNIQENDLPRKRVRKASKIAGSGGQYLEIRYPERGRKRFDIICYAIIENGFGNKIPREGTETQAIIFPTILNVSIFGNKIPREGTETITFILLSITTIHLEIRYPERGRKRL